MAKAQGRLASIHGSSKPVTAAFSSFNQRETLAQSIARLDAVEAIFFQQRAADNATLAAQALVTGAPVETAARLQRAAAYFAAEARRSLSRLTGSNARSQVLEAGQ